MDRCFVRDSVVGRGWGEKEKEREKKKKRKEVNYLLTSMQLTLST